MKAVSILLGIVSLASAEFAAATMPIVQVSPGIYRGPAPREDSDYGQLASLGIRTVVDIRSFRRRLMEEERQCLKAHGIAYRQVPVSFRPQRGGSAERAFCALTDVGRYPMYIHCELGRDRAGLIIALYRVRIQGWSMQAAFSEMKSFGFKSRFRGLERYFWEYAK